MREAVDSDAVTQKHKKILAQALGQAADALVN
jgi:hypothetical protein